jgi:hypothetical protein
MNIEAFVLDGELYFGIRSSSGLYFTAHQFGSMMLYVKPVKTVMGFVDRGNHQYLRDEMKIDDDGVAWLPLETLVRLSANLKSSRGDVVYRFLSGLPR